MCRLFFCIDPGGANHALLRKFLQNANKAGQNTRDAVDGIGFAIPVLNQLEWTTMRTLANNSAEYRVATHEATDVAFINRPIAMLAHIRIYVHNSTHRMPRTFPYFDNQNALQPICFGQFAMAMKGELHKFPDSAVRARIRGHISPKFTARLTGLSDTELVFYLILTYLCAPVPESGRRLGPTRIATAIQKMVRAISAAQTELAATVIFSTRSNVAVTTCGSMCGATTTLFVRTRTDQPFAAANYAVSPDFTEISKGSVIVASFRTGTVVHTGAL